jgi:hypothetical protein
MNGLHRWLVRLAPNYRGWTDRPTMSDLRGRLSPAPLPALCWQALADQDGVDVALGGDAAAHQPPAPGGNGPSFRGSQLRVPP